ncbi:MAG: type II secretion system protein, partial [Planctomycetota bacterium]
MKKRGFTLLELLIVIGLIATLMTLSVVVMSGFLTTAEVEATSATIQKTFRLLEQRTDAFDRSFKGSRKQLEISRIRFLLARQELFGVSEESVELLARKAAYRFEFPQRMVERTTIGEDINSNGILDSGEDINSNGVLDGLDNVPNGAAYPNLAVGQTASVPGMPFSIYDKIAYPIALQQLIKEGNATPTSDLVNARVTLNWSRHQTATESAELLYYTLVYSTSYGSAAVDSDRFTNAEVRDTDGDGLPEFVDAWEQPLRFYRWPTRLIDTHPPVPFQPVLSDPNDATDVKITVDTNNDGI